MFSFLSKKHDPNVSLVVDIGTGSIGVALVHGVALKAPEVLVMRREIIPFREKLDVTRFVQLMQETLTVALDDIASKSSVFPGSAMISLASPWYVAQTRLVHFSQDSDFMVTEKSLRQITDDEIKLFLGDSASSNTANEMGAQQLIDARAVSIRLNGYTARHVTGRMARELDMALYCAMMPEMLSRGLTEVISRRYGTIPIRFHAFMYAVYDIIRDHFTDESSSYIIVDAAGEATDVALVRDDILLETFSFPIGHRSVLRSVMRELDLEGVAAVSALDLYLGGDATPEHVARMEPIVEKAMRDWQRLFRGSLEQIAAQYPIPREMYLLADERYREHYEKQLFEAGGDVLSETGERFRVHALDKNLLEHFVKLPISAVWDDFLCVIIMMAQKLK